MVKKQNCVKWLDKYMLYVSLYTQKQMIFTKILQEMLKDLTFQIMNQKGCYQEGKTKK